MTEPLLTVVMSCYNQADTVAQAIESVLMQKTDFPVRLIVTDDHSTKDGSVGIVKSYAAKYPDRIVALLNDENGRYLKNVLRAMEQVKSEYFTLLDADDYWTDPNYLSDAVLFLRAHDDFTVYFRNVAWDDGAGGKGTQFNAAEGDFDMTFDDFTGSRTVFPQTTGAVFRNVIYRNGVPPKIAAAVGTIHERPYDGDVFRFLLHLHEGRAHFENKVPGVYRKVPAGVFVGMPSAKRDMIQAQCFVDYCDYFGTARRFFEKQALSCYGRAVADASAQEVADDPEFLACRESVERFCLGRREGGSVKTDALSLFLRQHRFDLIFKYLYVRGDGYAREAYLESIRAFNGFDEVRPSDGRPKGSAEDFLGSFDSLIASVRSSGFDAAKGALPVGTNGEICDGAHRLAAAAALGGEVAVEGICRADDYGFEFFRERGMREDVMDFGALKYVELNPNAWIVNLHAVADPAKDDEVEAILNRHGFVYYRKSVRMDFNGYVNLKKLSYGTFWERETWIGSAADGFPGAQMHARESLGDGRNPMRILVFVCESAEEVLKAKAEIRALFGKGNFSVHINDTHEEAVWLAQTYFNANSLEAVRLRPFTFEDARFDGLVREFKDFVRARGACLDDVCAAGSTAMNALGLRPCSDFDFFAKDAERMFVHTETLSVVIPEWARFYPSTPADIIGNPSNHFYFQGVKFVAPRVLLQMKLTRRDGKKDANDIRLLKRAVLRSVLGSLDFRSAFSAVRRFVYSKERTGAIRKVRILGVIGFSYSHRRRTEG